MNARISCLIVSLAVLLGLTTWEVIGSPQPASAESESLTYIPGDSLLFLHFEGKALWNSTLVDELQRRIPAAKWKKLDEDVFRASEKVIGIARKDLRSATLIVDSWDLPQTPSLAMLIASANPIDREKYIKGLKTFFASYLNRFDEGHSAGPSIQHEGVELSPVGSLPNQKLYAGLAKNNIAVIGEVEVLRKLISQNKSGLAAGPLAASIKAARGHDVAMGMQLPESLQNQLQVVMQMTMNMPQTQQRPDFMQMKLGSKLIDTLLEMKKMQIAMDVQKNLALHIVIQANNEKTAVRFQRMLDLMALFGDFGFQYLEDLTERAPSAEAREMRKILPLLAEASANSKTSISGTTVEFIMKSEDSGPALMSAATAFFIRLIMIQDRLVRQSNLRQLAIAMHNYHNDYNKLPPPGTYKNNRAAPTAGSNEKPLLSWRVQMLPYVEADNLYKQFHFDEPWDSEHNKKLIPLMPKIYACPGATDPGPGKTYLQVFVAPEKPARADKQMFAPIFQWGRASITLGQLTVQDGTSNTLMIAESSEPVIWTKPEDILIEDDLTPLPKLGCVPDEDDFLVAFGDASIRALRRSLPNSKEHEKLLRQLIGRRDGMNEDVGPITK